jgi:phosphate transport system substrate-binding protein
MEAIGNMRLALLTALILGAVALPTAGLADGELTYSGSSTIGTGFLEAGAAEAFEEGSGIRFDSIEQPGSGKGVRALIDGKVALAGASRPLKPNEKSQKLIGSIIGYDAIAVFVHKTNPVDDLSKDQLKRIFTGEIKNWREVGGEDAPILPNTEILTGKRATVEMFRELVLDDAPYGTGFKALDYPRDQIIDLADTKNGICSVSRGLLASLSSDVRARVKTISVGGIDPSDRNVRSGAYLASRPLLLVSRGLPKGQVKEFIRFSLSPEGQAIVAKNFVPVRTR